MAAPSDTLTYEQNPPHRPGLDELGGGGKKNHATRPPDPVTMPTAPEYNQFSRQIEALSRMIPFARVWVRFAAGVPIVDAVQGARSDLVAADFTITDNGTGDTTIAWTTGANGRLPATQGKGPVMSIIEEVNVDRWRAVYSTIGGNPCVRVKTFLSGAGVDCGFVVELS